MANAKFDYTSAQFAAQMRDSITENSNRALRQAKKFLEGVDPTWHRNYDRHIPLANGRKINQGSAWLCVGFILKQIERHTADWDGTGYVPNLAQEQLGNAELMGMLYQQKEAAINGASIPSVGVLRDNSGNEGLRDLTDQQLIQG